jgi:putative addiction module component (TIGR02574 family)
MNAQIKAIEKAIEKLSDEEQAKLATDILDRLHGSIKEVEDAWIEEGARRLDAIRRGEMKTYDADDVIAEARERLRRRRKT